MGAQESRPVAAYHVTRVERGSLAERAGIQVFFDFVIGINERELDEVEAVTLRPGQNILVLFSLLTNAVREVRVDLKAGGEQGDPTPAGAGAGLGPACGLTLRRCDPPVVRRSVWRCAAVQPHSPAARAGLIAQSGEGDDYVLACEQRVLVEGEELGRQLMAAAAAPEAQGRVSLLVYRPSAGRIRRVRLHLGPPFPAHDHGHEHPHPTAPQLQAIGAEWTMEDDSIFAHRVPLVPVA